MRQNNKIKRLSLILVVSALITIILSTAMAIPVSAAGVVPPATDNCKAFVLYDKTHDEYVVERSGYAILNTSTSAKIMMGLIACEELEHRLDESVTITAEMLKGASGYSMKLKEGEVITIRDLLYGAICGSYNDAAYVLATVVGGSAAGFTDMMNEKAAKMGLSNTHFENPHGLDGESHYTTAYELALITREAMANPILREICSTYKKTIPLNETEGVRLLINHNKLLRSYEGAIGVKTGFTKKSGRCLVSAAERDGLTLIAVTLGAPDDWRDHTAMLDYGFSLYEARTLCDIGSFSYIMPLSGSDTDHIILENAQKITVILPRNASEIKCVIELPRFCLAPIKEGDEIGKLVYYLGGEKIAESAIIAKTGAESTNSNGFWTKIFK